MYKKNWYIRPLEILILLGCTFSFALESRTTQLCVSFRLEVLCAKKKKW